MKHRMMVLALIAGGCAPELEGSDQVYDPNYEFTVSADQQLSEVWYPAADARVDDLLTQGATGCGYGLVEDGEVFYVQGVGTWPLAGVAPLGSVAKTFTALGVARLMEETPGLDPTDSIQQYLPNAPWNVTIGQLLDHTTGLDDWASFGNGPNLGAYPGVSHPMQEPRYAFEQYSPYETLSTPVGGIDPSHQLTIGNYSNVGYAVLGALIDEVVTSGSYGVDGYEQWIWREVARGGNLTSGSPTAALFHTWRVGDIPGLVDGHIGGVEATQWDVTGDAEGWEGPPGGWSTTAGDLARLVAAIQRGDIVGDATWLQPSSAVDIYGTSSREKYGWGVVIERPVLGATRYMHPGENEGYTAIWAWYDYDDGRDFGVALICDGDVGKDAAENTVSQLHIAWVLDELVPELPLGELDPVGEPSVVDQRYAIDVSASTTDLPGIGFPGAWIATDLTLSVASGRSGLDLTLVGATGATWRSTSFDRDPQVATATADVRLPVDGGELSLERASLSGAFADGGASLVDIELRGALDTRTIPASWIWGHDACREAAALGHACEPCSDGASVCLPVGITGWTGAAP